MSEYGIKIKNYEAASLYEYLYGFRGAPDAKDAMLTNSLFKDFLVENGLEVRGDSTRDIICVAFGYKTKGNEYIKNKYELLEKRAGEIGDEEQRTTYLARLEKMRDQYRLNKDKCYEISRQDLRIMFYEQGITIPYPVFGADKQIVGTAEIHYKMLYRTPGKAKNGTCMFIRDELYDKAREFLYMGIQLPTEKAPIVEIGAYSSLITSGIVGKVQIKPEQIFIMRDVESTMNAAAVLIKINEQRQCYAETVDNYPITNTMFDGQALIDASIFPDWGDGYILLRHHFCKMAAFNTNIQQFFRDYYGADYEAAEITDMFGNVHKVKDIRLITTDNAVKWLKFPGITYDYWLSWLAKNDYMFGVVKTAHESKLGNVQRMSYQMVNALDINSMPEVMGVTIQYIERLKNNNEAFLDYLRRNVNFANNYEVLVALAEHNADFMNTDYFKTQKTAIIQQYLKNIKEGHIIQNADNLVIVGSPYAMLLATVGDDPLSDPTFETEDVATQCWCGKFRDGEYLAEFRSPFNSRNNLGYLHNHYHEYFNKYFNLGKLCIAVNMIGTDFQAKNNGSD